MKYCKNCGQQAVDQRRYCSNCGEYFSEEGFFVKEELIKFCPSCGNYVDKNYCPHCGTYVKKVSVITGNPVADAIMKKTSKLKNKVTHKIMEYKWPLLLVMLVVVVVVWANVNSMHDKKDSVNWVHYSENGQVGFKDTKGNIKIEAEYSDAGNYTKNGLVKVQDDYERWGFIDYQGHYICGDYLEVGDFADNGLARVHDEESDLWGYINSKGEMVIEPQFLKAEDFSSDGTARVYTVSCQWKYIDRYGN